MRWRQNQLEMECLLANCLLWLVLLGMADSVWPDGKFCHNDCSIALHIVSNSCINGQYGASSCSDLFSCSGFSLKTIIEDTAFSLSVLVLCSAVAAPIVTSLRAFRQVVYGRGYTYGIARASISLHLFRWRRCSSWFGASIYVRGVPTRCCSCSVDIRAFSLFPPQWFLMPFCLGSLPAF